MFRHVKQLQYTVRVAEPNPGLANLLLEQFGGPQGELAAACRYFTQGLSDDDPGRKDMLMDIATEELSHLEIIGTLVGMLNKGAKGAWRRAPRARRNSIVRSPPTAMTAILHPCCTAAVPADQLGGRAVDGGLH
jgi:Mn-containing catalase